MQDSSESPSKKEIEAEELVLNIGLDVSAFRYEVCRLDSLNFSLGYITTMINRRYSEIESFKNINKLFISKYISDLKEVVEDCLDNGYSFSKIHSKRKIPVIFLYKYFDPASDKNNEIYEDDLGEGASGELPEFYVTSPVHFKKHTPSMDYLKRYKNWNL
jgi:hypothetical protein